jgi:hypothetical protein
MLSRILLRLLAKKVCVLSFSLGSCSNLSYIKEGERKIHTLEIGGHVQMAKNDPEA